MIRILKNTAMTILVLALAGLAFGQGPGGGHHGGGHHGGGHGNPGLDSVTVAGDAIVLVDSSHCFLRTLYFIDVDGDDAADHLLRFGPPDYVPASGAERPEDGDAITITGGLREIRDRSMIIVWELNGLEWISPDSMHVGDRPRPGGPGHGQHVPLDSLTVEGMLTSVIDTVHGQERPRFFLDTDQDGENDYFLRLRRLFHTDPEFVLPDVGTMVAVEGGLIDCDINLDGIVVLAINAIDNQTDQFMAADGELSTDYKLASRNYPNPFNPETTIEYYLPAAGNVEVTVYDLAGHEIARLTSEHKSAGTHFVTWNSRDNQGRPVTSGIYFYRITAGGQSITKQMLLLK